MKFGYILPSGFREESRLKVWTDDGRTTDAACPISSPRSFRLRGAKKANVSHILIAIGGSGGLESHCILGTAKIRRSPSLTLRFIIFL